MAATSLKFKWGQVQNNEKFTNPNHTEYKIDNGAVYVATDERSIYVDYNGKRIRLGDFLEYATLDDLKKDYASWNTSTLAYIATGDMLVKYDEKKGWIQLNDTSSLTAAINSLNKDVSDIKGSISEHGTALSTLESNIGKNAKNIKANADAIGDENNGLIKAVADNAKDIAENAKNIKANADAIGDENSGILHKIKLLEDSISDGDISLGDLDDRVLTLEGLATDHGRQLGEQDTKITNILNDIGNANTSGTIKGEINSLQDALNNSTTGLIKKVSDNTNAIGQNATNINGLDERLSSLEGSFDEGLEIINDHDSRLNTAEGNISNLQNGVTGNTSSINGLTSRIGQAEATIGEHTTSINQLDSKIDTAKEELKDYIDNNMQTADAMTFRGIISTYAELPTTGVQKGDTYKVSQKISNADGNVYQEADWFVGDLIIAKADQTGDVYAAGWYHISSGYEDDYNAYITGSSATNTVQLNGGAGEDKGSISFSSANACLEIGLSASATSAGAISQDCSLALDLVWDTF